MPRINAIEWSLFGWTQKNNEENVQQDVTIQNNLHDKKRSSVSCIITVTAFYGHIGPGCVCARACMLVSACVHCVLHWLTVEKCLKTELRWSQNDQFNQPKYSKWALPKAEVGAIFTITNLPYFPLVIDLALVGKSRRLKVWRQLKRMRRRAVFIDCLSNQLHLRNSRSAEQITNSKLEIHIIASLLDQK